MKNKKEKNHVKIHKKNTHNMVKSTRPIYHYSTQFLFNALCHALDITTKSHLIRVTKLELPVMARPVDDIMAGWVGQKLQQKLPQLDRSRALKKKH